MKNELYDLMIKAIKEERHPLIKADCREIWNQPFFYRIDKAKVITLSYAPTDKGAQKNYTSIYEKYKKDKNSLTAEEIYEILYNFQKEVYWRKWYDKIFTSLGIKEIEIAHLDMSSFPYDKDAYRKKHSSLDKSYVYTLQAVDLLLNQLEYILIDGKDNKEMFNTYFSKDYYLIKKEMLRVNNSGRLSELSIYNHKEKDVKLIYFGTFLYGATCVSEKCVNEIVEHIKSIK